MKCPTCGWENKNGCKFCEECGERLTKTNVNNQTLQLAKTSGFALGAAARQRRLEADYSGNTVISARKFNAIMGGVVLWGLLVNIILCLNVGDVYRYINPTVFTILYVVLVGAGVFIAAIFQNPLISFLGYNMIVVPFGLVISTLIEGYGGIDSAVVTSAFAYTILVTMGILAMALAFPKLFEKLGGALLAVLAGAFISELILLLLGVEQQATNWVIAAVFACYIGYDIYRSQKFVKTVDNAVDCALDIYLDIANLFIRILQIVAESDDD